MAACFGAVAAAVDQAVPGTKLLIKTKASAPAKNKLAFVAKAFRGLRFGLPDPGGENDPTSAGGTLRVLSAGSEVQALALPADCGRKPCWKGLGKQRGTKGYVYRDRKRQRGACTSVVIKKNLIKAICKGDAVGVAPALSLPVNVIVEVGTEPIRYCARFDGAGVKRNEPGLFKGKTADLGGCSAEPTTTTTATTLAVTSTTTTSTTQASTTTVAFTWTQVQQVLNASCTLSLCHGNGGAQSGLGDLDDFDQAYDNLVNQPSQEAPSLDRVEPFDPLNSYLMHKLDGTQGTVGGSGQRMPRDRAPLASGVRDSIRAWIEAGAPKN